MAKVKIWQDEQDDDFLPQVCMACGAPATTEVRKGFSWHPPWVIVTILGGLIVYVIIALILTKRMTVHAPLCEQHRGYFKRRAWIIGGSFGITALLALAAFAFMISQDQPGAANRDLSGYACLGVMGLGLAWLILVAVVQFVSMRPTEITSDSITLTNVSQGFKDALQDARDEEDERHEERRRERKQGRSRGDTRFHGDDR